MTAKIDTVKARSALKPRREPYWQKLARGLSVGFRKSSDSTSGTWHVRSVDSAGQKTQISFGPLDSYPPHAQFDKAADTARRWLAQHTGTVVENGSKPATVMDACDLYVERTLERRGATAAKELKERYRRWVQHDPIHILHLQSLTQKHIIAWRRRLVAAPVMPKKEGRPQRIRSKVTVNRDMAALRAALNNALADELVPTDAAWREPLKPFTNVSKRRTLYLDKMQRQKLVEHSSGEIKEFLRALSILPLRPGAMASLTVGDFDERLNVLKIDADKSGQGRRIKIPEEIANTLRPVSYARSHDALLFHRYDGSSWTKDTWKYWVHSAAVSAGLPARVTIYTLRHSVITDLVHGGLDLLTVAQLSGTSVAMIEKHYGHLRDNVASEALAKLVF